MLKKTVHYKAIDGLLYIGKPATVWPVDHYNKELVSNKTWVRTSPVVRIFESGDGFETTFSIYRKAKGKNV